MFKDVVQTTSEALELESNNAKALYRRSLAYKAFAEKINETQELSILKQQFDFYEKSRKDLEKLDSIEKNNASVFLIF